MLTLTSAWVCDLCGAEQSHRQSALHVGSAVDLQNLPLSWSYINGKAVCPKHAVVVDPVEFHQDHGHGRYTVKVNFTSPPFQAGKLYCVVPLPREPQGAQDLLAESVVIECECGAKFKSRVRGIVACTGGKCENTYLILSNGEFARVYNAVGERVYGEPLAQNEHPMRVEGFNALIKEWGNEGWEENAANVLDKLGGAGKVRDALLADLEDKAAAIAYSDDLGGKIEAAMRTAAEHEEGFKTVWIDEERIAALRKLTGEEELVTLHPPTLYQTCTCPDVVNTGCVCGAMERERKGGVE